MVAAEIAETYAGVVSPHLQKTGQGLKCISYTATVTTSATDYVVLGDFTKVTNVRCEVVSSGATKACTITSNEVTFADSGTGAVRFVVWGY